MKGNGTRRRFSGRIKAKVALEALQEQKTAAQIAGEYECHPSQIAKWKKEAIQGLPGIFATRSSDRSEEKLAANLYEQIGRLKMELEWFKKKSGGVT